MKMEKSRNILMCPKCGVKILTEGNVRVCYKCDTPMNFIKKEFDEDKK